LVTLWTAYSFRALAGFVSRRQRSWDSPFGAFSSRKVSAAFPRGCTHVPFRPSVIPPPKRWAGPTSRGFWGSTLPGVPGGQTGFNSPTAGCSLGLYPPRAYRREPGPSIQPGLLPHTFAAATTRIEVARRLGVSINSRLTRPVLSASRQAGPSSPFRVSAPVRARTRERPTARAMGSPRAASHIAADRRHS
jgi:hypothetical protein